MVLVLVWRACELAAQVVKVPAIVTFAARGLKAVLGVHPAFLDPSLQGADVHADLPGCFGGGQVGHAMRITRWVFADLCWPLLVLRVGLSGSKLAFDSTGPARATSYREANMPAGFISVDARNTFQSAIFMAATAKTIFGTDQPDIAKDGQRKYSADLAVTYCAEPGRKPVSEVIRVSLTGTDPSTVIQPGSQVEFDQLRCSVSTPERREGSSRISGGRLFFMAGGLRPVHGQRSAEPKAA